ncbi:hypothetical protein LXA43DRAFT_907058 [Ganoderma leucocontextum]|nr:hypothetical protein LXA43DRAFT_907058 [Ganoderma leucocontextum]
MPSLTLTAQHDTEPMVIYAKWRQRLPACNSQTAAPPYIDRYHIVIPPYTPLAVGQRVKILALFPTAYYAPDTRPLTHPIIYDTYDPKIQGRLLRVRAMAANTVEFVLDNETPGAAVVLAYVAIHHIPGYTTRLGSVEKVCKWATGNEPDLNFIPLETRLFP